MKTQMIQVDLKVPMSRCGEYQTVYRQDSDSKFFDDDAAEYFVVEQKIPEIDEIVTVSRTRIHFRHENLVWADSPYLMSLGNEDEIYSRFIQSKKCKECGGTGQLNHLGLEYNCHHCDCKGNVKHG